MAFDQFKREPSKTDTEGESKRANKSGYPRSVEYLSKQAFIGNLFEHMPSAKINQDALRRVQEVARDIEYALAGQSNRFGGELTIPTKDSFVTYAHAVLDPLVEDLIGGQVDSHYGGSQLPTIEVRTQKLFLQAQVAKYISDIAGRMESFDDKKALDQVKRVAMAIVSQAEAHYRSGEKPKTVRSYLAQFQDEKGPVETLTYLAQMLGKSPEDVYPLQPGDVQDLWSRVKGIFNSDANGKK